MIGKLQSNKAKEAVKIFDFIHSLDSKKLADKLKKSEILLSKKIQYFIQVNIGNESQKNGINIKEAELFYTYCINDLDLKILGFMAIPPEDQNPDKYFKILYDLNISLNLPELSMGMSADYMKALEYHATFVRIGSSIFGNRN